MSGFERIKAMEKAIKDGAKDFTMMIADFHLTKGTITQEQFNELHDLAYPTSAEQEGPTED